MREILFKAKRMDNGEWVEGNIIKDGLTGQIFIHASGNSVNESDKVGEEGCLKFVAFEVNEDTLCQYTGLTDKHGKKIWENDIIESYIEYDDFRNKSEKGVIRYTYGMYEIQIEEYEGKPVYSDFMADIALSGCPFEMKVLGNVFDNPELLNDNH